MSRSLTVEESLWARWGRRALTVPLYLALGTGSVALLPITIALALAVDGVRRTGRFATVRFTLALTIYFACEAGGVVASFGVWLASVLLPRTSAERAVTWNLILQRAWARILFSAATRLFGMRVEVSGLDSARRGFFFLFSRHVSLLDTLLPAVFVSNPHTLRLAYVMKRELLWDPCLDIVGHRTRNAFVRRGSDQRDTEIDILRQLALTATERDGVLLFPEGTRFSPAKRERALKHFANTNQLKRLTRARRFSHVLPPHRGGALALLETRPESDVVFLAHVGFEGTSSLREIWRGVLIGRTIRLFFWRIPSAEIPPTRESRAGWLDAQWERLDKWVAAQTGSRQTMGPHAKHW